VERAPAAGGTNPQVRHRPADPAAHRRGDMAPHRRQLPPRHVWWLLRRHHWSPQRPPAAPANATSRR